MPSKTHIAIVQEFCVKHRTIAVYEPIPTDQDNIFSFEVSVFGHRAIGRGQNKKNAKHEAAANLISVLIKNERFRDDFCDQLEVPRNACAELDAVSLLLDLCIERNLPLAQFQIQQASGAAHAPEFVFECQVANIVRLGTFSTKKGAKQLAAKQMLDVLQNLTTEERNMQLSRNAKIEAPEKLFKRYYELKKTEQKVNTGVKLADRYMYFVNLDDTIQQKIKDVLYKVEASDQAKVDLICRAMNCKSKVSLVSRHPLNYSCVEIFCAYDLCFVNTIPQVYSEIIDYFKVALSFKNRTAIRKQ